MSSLLCGDGHLVFLLRPYCWGELHWARMLTGPPSMELPSSLRPQSCWGEVSTGLCPFLCNSFFFWLLLRFSLHHLFLAIWRWDALVCFFVLILLHAFLFLQVLDLWVHSFPKNWMALSKHSLLLHSGTSLVCQVVWHCPHEAPLPVSSLVFSAHH